MAEPGFEPRQSDFRKPPNSYCKLLLEEGWSSSIPSLNCRFLIAFPLLLEQDKSF